MPKHPDTFTTSTWLRRVGTMRKSICNTLYFTENRRVWAICKAAMASRKILRNAKAIGRTILHILNTKTLNNEPLLANSIFGSDATNRQTLVHPPNCHTLQVPIYLLRFSANFSFYNLLFFSLRPSHLTKFIEMKGAPPVIIRIYLYLLTLTSIYEKKKLKTKRISTN